MRLADLLLRASPPSRLDSPTMRICTAILLTSLFAIPSGAFAVEGKWTPEQVLEHDAKWLRELGLEIPPEKLNRRT
jgi:hypothetical protein